MKRAWDSFPFVLMAHLKSKATKRGCGRTTSGEADGKTVPEMIEHGCSRKNLDGSGLWVGGRGQGKKRG